MQKPFIPKDGQVDYTNIRYGPVVNSIVVYRNKLLLVKRSPDMRLYPGVWNGVSGFLDDHESIEEKVATELREELGLAKTAIVSIERGQPLLQEAPEYNKTWLVVPVRVKVSSDKIKLDWEASEAKWFTSVEAKTQKLMPGFLEVLETFFP